MDKSSFQWLLSAILIVAGLFMFTVKDKKAFFDHPKLKNVPGGILAVIGLMLVVSLLFGCSTYTSFNYAEMSVGVDYDPDSLFCRDPVPDIVTDDHVTSNIELALNVFQSGDRTFDGNITYSHHSCAVNQDKPTYDAWGIDLKKRFNF